MNDNRLPLTLAVGKALLFNNLSHGVKTCIQTEWSPKVGFPYAIQSKTTQMVHGYSFHTNTNTSHWHWLPPLIYQRLFFKTPKLHKEQTLQQLSLCDTRVHFCVSVPTHQAVALPKLSRNTRTVWTVCRPYRLHGDEDKAQRVSSGLDDRWTAVRFPPETTHPGVLQNVQNDSRSPQNLF